MPSAHVTMSNDEPQDASHAGVQGVPDAPGIAGGPPVILFDGACNLCNGAVQWILARDRRGRLRFASLQSEAALEVLRRVGFIGEPPDSILFVENGRVRAHSSAALAIARQLGLPWSLATVSWLVPSFLRDAVYRWIARNRYRWFGRREHCLMPTPALRGRFLDAEQ